MNEYIVPFKVDGNFIIKAKDEDDLKLIMDKMLIGELMETSENIQLTAYPERAELIEEIKTTIKKKTKKK